MNRLLTLSISLVLLLIAFPLISIGTTSGPPVLWWAGLAALVVGGVLPPLRRLFPGKEPLPEPTKVGLPEDDRVS
ncbi:hypothetical protein K1T73_15490 [Roseovarius sp. SCSIO 43702]|uniref:hypothetical protein n=1 Tax=Roseovarius sp. SCSIO 43702 TaxID=2823043 RepID=UPI001C739B50|nr:hypothetical protein [Roseovarius sp. SCSIO 43702]QYX56437.1 hypothetical protein K1T73_15490 [Roseovarius sp. SCSIO 43702]